jgi:hypothetical protein
LVVKGRVGIDRGCLLSGDESLPRIALPNDGANRPATAGRRRARMK